MATKRVICDVETDSLEPKEIYMIGFKDIDTEEEEIIHNPGKNDERVLSYMEDVGTVVGHNIIAFDILKALRPLVDEYFASDCRIIDTLVLSRLIYYNRPGGHSAENLGKLVGVQKKEFNPTSEDYLRGDLRNHLAIFRYFERFINDPEWQRSIEIEHHSAFMCEELHRNGFAVDRKLLHELITSLDEEIEKENILMKKSAPLSVKFIRKYTPRKTKDGKRFILNSLGPYKEYDDIVFEGAPFSAIEFSEFNPASPKQRSEALHKAGWKPIEKTAGHLKYLREIQRKKRTPKIEERLKHFEIYGYTLSETNLETLPEDAPEYLHRLSRWVTLTSRRGKADEIQRAIGKDGKIHGRYNHIGSWTHRKSHRAPNQANLPRPFHAEPRTEVERISAKYNSYYRKIFRVSRAENWLVGTDAEAIQLRILAHLMDDEDYTRAIVHGKKEDGTDIHSVNLRALELEHLTRDNAKTFIYAWLLGAQIGKIKQILDCSSKIAAEATQRFLDRTPALKELKEHRLPKEAKQGYFVGLDGRKVICSKERLILAGHLQANESIIMKHSCRLWYNELTRMGIHFRLVNDVHDEWQTEVRGTRETAELVGQVQSDAITKIGIELGCKVPLSGSFSIGKTWYDTH